MQVSEFAAVKAIKVGDWTGASFHSDYVAANAILQNEEWVWAQIVSALPIMATNLNIMNNTSFGNIAFAVVYGARFPEREASIAFIKAKLSTML